MSKKPNLQSSNKPIETSVDRNLVGKNSRDIFSEKKVFNNGTKEHELHFLNHQVLDARNSTSNNIIAFRMPADERRQLANYTGK